MALTGSNNKDLRVKENLDIAKRVNRAWDEIELLVGQLDAKQLDSLNPPATKAQLDELSQSLSLNLPAEIEASLLRHNGCKHDNVFLLYHFFSTEQIANKTLGARRKREVWMMENPGESFDFEDGGWNDQLILMGTSFAGVDLVIDSPDCDTAVPYIRVSCNYSMQLTYNYSTYLESFAYHLRNGNYINEFGTLEFDHWAEYWPKQSGPQGNAR